MQHDHSKQNLAAVWRLNRHGRLEMCWKATPPATAANTGFATPAATPHELREAA